jgi:uncharacterized protein (UPF0335 family)
MAKRTSTTEGGKDFTGPINDEALARHVAQIERHQEQRAAISEKIAQDYKDARSAGFTPRLLRRIIAERKLDPETRAEQYRLLDRMRQSLGMLEGTPLGDAAMRANGATDEDLAPPADLAQARATRAKPGKTFAEQPVHRGRSGRRLRAPHSNGEHGPDLPPAA